MSATEKLYRTDSWRLDFEARVLECRRAERGLELILDRSAFYPTGGGQPHDTGHIDDRAVRDVFVEEERVVHLLDEGVEFRTGQTVKGKVDGARRLDHLQQHSAQHLLSQAFVEGAGAETTSFHLGRESCNIDLDRTVDEDRIRQAEDRVNQVVFEDREVRVHEVGPDELARFDLRKPGFHGERIRLVEFVGFDITTCGGTHAHRSGQVGLLTVLGSERFKGGTRVHFVAGGRALAFFRRDHGLVQALGRRLDVGADRLQHRVEQLADELREARREAKQWFEQAVDARAATLREGTPEVDGLRVVSELCRELDRPQLEALARAIVQTPGTVAALASDREPPARYVLARSEDLGLHCGQWMKRWATRGAVRGGGAAGLAQGVGGEDDDLRARLDEALALRLEGEERS